jgi:N-acetylglucosaminyldiphosphoundecaprenol N-acetyl-beta-D-mannosaminyltransferase
MNDTLHAFSGPLDSPAPAPEHFSQGVPVWTSAPPFGLPAEPTGDPSVADRTWIWGVPLAAVTFEATVDWVERMVRRGQPAFFITANLHYAALTDRDPRLQRVNRSAAFLVADGMPMVWYSRILGRPLPQRVSGADLLFLLCARAADRGYRVFLLGGAPGVADQAAELLQGRYPALQIVGTAAPELDQLSPEAHEDMIRRIRAAGTQLLLVAFGQPKGELWLAENLEALGVPACVQLGASFDFVTGRLRRAPVWMQRTGLEWLYRTSCEPKRLLPRYLADARFLLRAVSRDLLAALRKRP